MDENEKFLVDFGETTVIGGGGTSDFNDLTNRPKYNNTTMTGSTNIPKVPTKTSELTNDSQFVEAGSLATVATTGDYDDLTDTPVLATVATSGSYNDLTNKPTIPAAQVQSDWSQADNTKVDYIKNKPTIPTVNDATLTITQNGTSKGTFTANDADDTTIEVTDTTYSNFTGTDGTAAGTAGLVPAPATTDAGKFLKADGTWDTAGGSSVNVVQTTGTSTTDVMSQKAVTDTLFRDNNLSKIQIGDNATASGSRSVAIGGGSTASKTDSIAIGTNSSDKAEATGNVGIAIGAGAKASGAWAVALGTGANANAQGQMDISTGSATTSGYSSSNYRLLTGLYDGQSAHDAVTKGQLDSIAIQNAGAPTTSTVGTVGQLLEDTTNGKLYICTDATNPYVWEEVGAGGGGPTVVQTTGTSTTDVMSQNAVTSMVYADPSTKYKIQLGINGLAAGNAATAMGYSASATGDNAIAIGNNSATAHKGGVSLGVGATTSAQGEVNIGAGSLTNFGYNNSAYRLISGVYDPQSAHDAATKGYVDNIVVNYATLTAAGAPTTSTAATSVGQLYYDSTNDAYYYCSAIDTTDPQNPSYTWSALSTGGGGPTVVQTTGTSTTDVMSQNAVTSMVFADPSTKNTVLIGNAIGGTSSHGVAIGHNVFEGEESVVIGENANGQSENTVAIGRGARATGRGSVAIGSQASMPPNAVRGTVSFYTTSVSYGYNGNSNYRLITGVYDGQGLHDAATVAQGNTLSTSAPTTSTEGVLGQLWTDTTNMHTYQCTAISGSTYTWTQRW